MWKCNQCGSWHDDPEYTLPACPHCGFDGYNLTVLVNGMTVPFRELTPDELPRMAETSTRRRFIGLRNLVSPGDDITYNNLSPAWDELWVRYPVGETSGNMRLYPA
jgi:hypothetical protein